MRKVIVIGLALLFASVSLIPVQAKAVTKPVEAERVKGFWFYRVKGDHPTASFLLHYVNLSPETQIVSVEGTVLDPTGNLKYRFLKFPTSVTPDATLDYSVSAGYGDTFVFIIYVQIRFIMASIRGSVVIPPTP